MPDKTTCPRDQNSCRFCHQSSPPLNKQPCKQPLSLPFFVLSVAVACDEATKTTPEWSIQQALRMCCKRAYQPVRRLRLSTRLTRCVRQPQETSRAAPALAGALQLRFVKLRNLIKLFELPVSFGNRLTDFVQTVTGHRQRQVLALVTRQQ